jgi:cyclase
LLYGDRTYNLSRNFNLQRVGDLGWVRENYEFNSIARSIDELVVLDVSRGERKIDNLAGQVEQLAQSCFMPIAAGGGIRSLDHAYRLFQAGADKIVLNSPLFSDPGLVAELSRTFGAQSIVASVDFRLGSDGVRRVFAGNGEINTGMSLQEALRHVAGLNVGEVYLTSINNDGTGNGFDLKALRISCEICQVPTIASGGAGNYLHLSEGLQLEGIKAVSTANLFNFMGNGIQEARESMHASGIPLCMWVESR